MLKNNLTGNVYGFISVSSYVGAVNGQSRYACQCLNCGKCFEADGGNIVRNVSGRCASCKDRSFTFFEDSVIAFRYSWFRHSVSMIAAWYEVSKPTIYASLKRTSASKFKK